MRRLFATVGMMAAIAAFTTQAQAAHTAAEIHVFFGAAQLNPVTLPNGSVLPTAGELVSNPSIDAPVGATVVFPIWAQILPGDGAQTYSSLGFRVFSEGTAGAVTNSGNLSSPVYPSTSQFTPAHAGNGSPNSSFPTLTEFRSGYFTQVAAGGSNLGQGTYFLGYMQVSAVAVGSVDFSFGVGADAASLFAGSNTVSTINTVAFGAGAGAGGLDSYRRGNTTLDVVGTVFDQVSAQADAHINVIPVPEPMTLSLLALGGIAALRRRKTA
jgi:hypothetical protein